MTNQPTKQDKRPVRAKKPRRVKHMRRARKTHPTDGWFSLGERAHLKESNRMIT